MESVSLCEDNWSHGVTAGRCETKRETDASADTPWHSQAWSVGTAFAPTSDSKKLRNAMSLKDQPDLVRLAAAANPFQAHIWQQALERKGIRCQVLGDYLDAGIGDIPGITSEIWVEPADAERAEAFLREHQGGSDAQEDNANADGIVTVASAFSVRETVDRLASLVASQGFTVFARIDHAANAAHVGITLRPTELLILGNPEVGTALMQDQQTAGLDLPVKLLAWEDADAQVWVSYYTANWIAQRHDLGSESAASIQKLEAVLANVSKAATTS
jgi:uncharacterized protein (DUF302 family)